MGIPILFIAFLLLSHPDKNIITGAHIKVINWQILLNDSVKFLPTHQTEKVPGCTYCEDENRPGSSIPRYFLNDTTSFCQTHQSCCMVIPSLRMGTGLVLNNVLFL